MHAFACTGAVATITHATIYAFKMKRHRPHRMCCRQLAQADSPQHASARQFQCANAVFDCPCVRTHAPHTSTASQHAYTRSLCVYVCEIPEGQRAHSQLAADSPQAQKGGGEERRGKRAGTTLKGLHPSRAPAAAAAGCWFQQRRPLLVLDHAWRCLCLPAVHQASQLPGCPAAPAQQHPTSAAPLSAAAGQNWRHLGC